MTELNGFLAKHEPVAKPMLYDVGSFMGEWRITAFIGSGGNAEVYRVVRDDGTSGTIGTGRTGCADGRARSPSAPQPPQSENLADESVGALKILLREDTASHRRFAQEVELLRENRSSSFARFLGAGEVQGRPYLVTELLEPIDLPNTDAAVADYLLKVCRCASVAKLRAVHAARQKCRAERAAPEAAYDLGSVKTGADYERFVANILTASNITVVRVGQSGDCGADLLANTATGTAVIQCKFYTHPVGYDAVKEAYTAKAIYHATAHTLAHPPGSPSANVPSELRSSVHAFVVSNAAFTTQARKAARQLNVTLANRAEIAALLQGDRLES